MTSPLPPAPDFLEVFSLIELALISVYLFMFAVIVVAIVVIAARVPTLIWSPTRATCALCGDDRWCREVNGRLICPDCRMEIRPAKRWWEL